MPIPWSVWTTQSPSLSSPKDCRKYPSRARAGRRLRAFFPKISSSPTTTIRSPGRENPSAIFPSRRMRRPAAPRGSRSLLEKGGLRARHGERVVLEEMNHAVHLLLARAQVVDEKPLAGPAPDSLGHGGKQAFLALDEGGLLRPQAQVRLDAETDGAAVLMRADLDALDHDPLQAPGAALRVLLRKKENALVEVEFFLFLCPEKETADFASRLLVGPSRGQRVVDDDESPGREVVRQALEAPGALLVRVEKGKELRVEGARRPVADRLGETLFRPGGQPQLTCPDPQVAKGPATGLLREDELAGRREGEFGEFLAGALGGDVHLADGLDLVALKQQPVRPRRRGRVDIDHVSPEAEISALLDERHPAVPAFGERCGEEVPVDCVADGDGGDEAGHDAPRHDLLKQGRPGYDDNGGACFRSGWRERGSARAPRLSATRAHRGA